MQKNKVNKKIRNLKFFNSGKKLKKVHIAVALAALSIVFGAFALGSGFLGGETQAEKPKIPSVSIGCDRVLWVGEELELAASVQNINNPAFNWTVDGKDAGSGQKIRQKLDKGEHRVVLTASFNNRTLSANQTTLVIDSTDGVSVQDSSASKNQWGFQTLYRGTKKGVKGVNVSVDSPAPSEVNACGFVSSKALLAGDHTWKATYQRKTIASGKFNIKEVNEVKITKLDIAKSYTAGSSVNVKIVVVNSGSTTIKGFEIRTLAVNNDYAWMGDKAKKEYVDAYDTDLKPGVTYDIPIGFTIPEKVSGIRPSGKYTITVSIVLKGQLVDKKVVNTIVK